MATINQTNALPEDYPLLDNRYAKENGNPTEKFKVADGEAADEAVNVWQLSKYIPNRQRYKKSTGAGGDRELGTTYTNNYPYEIFVTATFKSTGSNCLYIVEIGTDSGVITAGDSNTGVDTTGLYVTLSFPVPPGSTYKIEAASGNTTPVYINWTEFH